MFNFSAVIVCSVDISDLQMCVHKKSFSPVCTGVTGSRVHRSGYLLQHAGFSWWSVMGNVGGTYLPALPQCCCRYAGSQVLPGLFQMVRAKIFYHIYVACSKQYQCFSHM